jgi:molybdopterin-biosynthesis enzyme MoeA-like protein
MEHPMEIICIGNELLIGKILNTNENWLAKQATLHGVSVKRMSTVGDNLDRKPRFIIITGGLGPTYDDKTLEGVANSLNQKLSINEKAFQMVKEKYEAYTREGRMDKLELTPSRVKMATLPERATPIPNPVGTAPGVRLSIDESIMYILPGVPSEMMAIFDESIAPLLNEETGNLKFFEKSINLDGIMESALAPLIDQALQENPLVYFKSHPKGEERKPHIEIHLSTMASNLEIAEERLEAAKNQILKLITEYRKRP